MTGEDRRKLYELEAEVQTLQFDFETASRSAKMAQKRKKVFWENMKYGMLFIVAAGLCIVALLSMNGTMFFDFCGGLVIVVVGVLLLCGSGFFVRERCGFRYSRIRTNLEFCEARECELAAALARKTEMLRQFRERFPEECMDPSVQDEEADSMLRETETQQYQLDAKNVKQHFCHVRLERLRQEQKQLAKEVEMLVVEERKKEQKRRTQLKILLLGVGCEVVLYLGIHYTAGILSVVLKWLFLLGIVLVILPGLFLQLTALAEKFYADDNLISRNLFRSIHRELSGRERREKEQELERISREIEELERTDCAKKVANTLKE